jgi:hypothetical protein
VTLVTARSGETTAAVARELRVLSSSSGDESVRGAGKIPQLFFPVTGVALVGAGSGYMLVDLYVVADNGRHPRYVGRYDASSFGSLSDEDTAAGEQIGYGIAESPYRRRR